MATFILYKVIPFSVAALILIRLYFYIKHGNKGDDNAENMLTRIKILTRGNIKAEFLEPINYEAPKTLKDRINRAWFLASFVIVPFGILVWGVMSYEVFDHFSITGQVFFPALVSAFFLLPVSLMCGIFYVIIMFFMMMFCRK